MDHATNQSDLFDLRREIADICDGKGTFQDVSQPRDFRAYTPAPADERLQPTKRLSAPSTRAKFGRWLLRQKNRGDWIDGLAAGARLDPAFPKDGDPDEVRKRMSEQGADSDMFEALDDAERDWLAS
jgi:hypothetical protein